MDQLQLLESQKAQINQITNQVAALEKEVLAQLCWRAQPGSWSVLECLEHLNLYSDFYIPQMEHCIAVAQKQSGVRFKSGILGSYFAKSMLPTDKPGKMKTFKDKNPLETNLDKSVINRFLGYQQRMSNMVDAARQIDVNKVKIKTSISPLIKLNLGDTFQFLINHTIRHMRQIERVKERLAAA